VHFTPTSASWLTVVERWFATLTAKQIKRGGASPHAPSKPPFATIWPEQRVGQTIRLDHNR
jgi:hypothetical protein